jgi:amino acid transporter
MTGQAAAARLLFGMARDGKLPRALAAVDARHGVPRTALAASALLTMAVSIWAARRPDGLDVLVSIVDVGALAAFTLLHMSVVGYFVVGGKAPARAAHAVVPVLGAIVTAWVIVEARPLAQMVGALWAMAGLVAVAVQSRTRGSGF